MAKKIFIIIVKAIGAAGTKDTSSEEFFSLVYRTTRKRFFLYPKRKGTGVPLLIFAETATRNVPATDVIVI